MENAQAVLVSYVLLYFFYIIHVQIKLNIFNSLKDFLKV